MTFERSTEIWAGFVGNQTPNEFIELSRQQGLSTIEAAVDAYVRDIPLMTSSSYSAEEITEIREGLITYLQSHGYH